MTTDKKDQCPHCQELIESNRVSFNMAKDMANQLRDCQAEIEFLKGKLAIAEIALGALKDLK